MEACSRIGFQQRSAMDKKSAKADTSPKIPVDPFAAEQTVSQEEFGTDALRKKLEITRIESETPGGNQRFLEKTKTSQTRTRTGTTGSAEVTDFRQASRVPEELLTDPEMGGKRFAIEARIGKGATGSVFEMQDRSLNRTIAIKLLRHSSSERKESSKRSFIREARTTAMLEHPNIMPIHDIGVTDRDEMFFTMKRIVGASLGDAIRAARDERSVPEEFDTIDGRVRIFLKVCDALSYAHHRGFIHQDVKPDNIMLGEFGEVLVLDWGSALSDDVSRSDSAAIVGTPAYMSPEQARRDYSDERSDVYCLGATFFHALLLRHPVWADDADEFWEKKRNATLDPISPDEHRKIPRVLLDIALKAMKPRPEDRYQSTEEFAEDLKHYQEGMAVSAHRDSPTEMFLRLYRRNKKAFWVTSIAALIISGTGYLFFKEKLKEVMTWRKVYTEDFSRSSTSTLYRHWKASVWPKWGDMIESDLSDSIGWYVDQEALVGSADENQLRNITYREPIPGDIRVDWEVEGELKRENLNCFVAGSNRFEGYTFHIGGYGSPENLVLTKGLSQQILDHHSLPEGLATNRKYRMRMEKEGHYVRLFIDDKKIFDYRDPNPYTGIGHQHFGFECNNGNRVRIDNIRVYHHPLPLKMSPIAIADRYFENGLIRRALLQYREIYETYPDNEIARVALYKAGQCMWHLGGKATALKTFEEFEKAYPNHELVPFSMYERAKIHRSRRRTVLADSLYDELARNHKRHPVLRTILFDLTNQYSARYEKMKTTAEYDKVKAALAGAYLQERAREIQLWARKAGLGVSSNSLLKTASELCYFEEGVVAALRRFPNQRETLARALMADKQYESLMEFFPEQRGLCADALVAIGQYSRVLREYPKQRSACAVALVQLGRAEEVLRNYPEQDDARVDALMQLGRFEEASASASGPWKAFSVARALGKVPDILREHEGNLGFFSRVMGPVYMGRSDSVLEILRSRGDTSGEAYLYSLLVQGLPDKVVDEPRHIHSGIVADAYAAMGKPEVVIDSFPLNEDHVEDRIGALLQMGEFSQAYELADKYSVSHCAQILLSTGLGDEYGKRFPRRSKQRAEILLQMGRYDEILDHFTDQRSACAQALLKLGKPELVLKQYPDQRAAVGQALLDLGRGQECLRPEYRDRRHEAAQYLRNEGRLQELKEHYASETEVLSDLYLLRGEYDKVFNTETIYRLSPPRKFEFHYRVALDLIRRGKYEKGDSVLAVPPPVPFDYRWTELRFPAFLLRPVLAGLRGNLAYSHKVFKELQETNERLFGRRLWYEAGFLAGTVSVEEFTRQPFRFGAETRIELLGAIKSDMEGDSASALELYETFSRKMPGGGAATIYSATTDDFVTWRIEELRKGRTETNYGTPEG